MSEPWWISVVKGLVLINLLLLVFSYATLIERKVIGRMQLRYGPNRAGPFGIAQPFADLIKLLRKEAFFPLAANRIPYIVAPGAAAAAAMAGFAFIPFGSGWDIGRYHVSGVVADVPIALIVLF